MKFEEREAVVTVLCDALIDFGFVFVIELVFFFTDVDECLIVDVFFLIDVDDAFGFLIEIVFVPPSIPPPKEPYEHSFVLYHIFQGM